MPEKARSKQRVRSGCSGVAAYTFRTSSAYTQHRNHTAASNKEAPGHGHFRLTATARAGLARPTADGELHQQWQPVVSPPTDLLVNGGTGGCSCSSIEQELGGGLEQRRLLQVNWGFRRRRFGLLLQSACWPRFKPGVHFLNVVQIQRRLDRSSRHLAWEMALALRATVRQCSNRLAAAIAPRCCSHLPSCSAA